MRPVTASHSRSIARNTVLQSAGYVAGLGITVGSAALLTRYLGVRAYGTFSLLAVLLVLPVTVLNGSLDTLAVRRLSADDEATAFFRNVLGLKLAAAGAFAVLATAVAAAAPLGSPIRIAAALVGVSIVASGLQGTLLTVEQARQRFRIPVLVDIGGRAFALLAIGVLVIAPRPADPSMRVALVIGAGACASLFWLGVILVRWSRRHALRVAANRRVWRGLARGAGPLALISLLGLVNYRLDVVVLGALAGTRDVGIYAVATRFVDGALPLASFFVAASFPVLSATAAHSPEHRQRQARRAAEFLVLASVPLTVGGCVFAPQLIHIVAGSAYASAALPLRLLLASLPLSYLSTFMVFMLIAADRQRRIVPVVIASIALNLVLNVALIPSYGAVGPAVATLASELMGAIALVVIVRRTLGVQPLPVSVVKVATAGAAMLAAALLLRPLGTPAAAIVSVLVYGAGALSLRIVRPVDVRLFVQGAA
jgi:O-antigen/teichoic acid export membrane protein